MNEGKLSRREKRKASRVPLRATLLDLNPSPSRAARRPLLVMTQTKKSNAE